MQIITPGSTNTSVMLKRGGQGTGFRSPGGLKEKQIDLMTDDLRRSIERLDKVIGKSQMLTQASSSNPKKTKNLSRYSMEP